MTGPDFEQAGQFVAATARVLDRRRFGRLFGPDGPGPVRDAVAAYRNPDGGFGHALEPDGRCPGSQPLAIALALATLDEAGAWDGELAQGALGWLELHAPAAGGVVEADPSIARGQGVRPVRPAHPRPGPGHPGPGRARGDPHPAGLRAAAHLAGPRPVPARRHRRAPGPPGRGAAARRRLDVQLAGLVSGRGRRLARLDHG